MESRMIHVGLDGIIQLQQSGDTIECFIRDINEDYTEAAVIAFNPQVSRQEEVELSIFVPTETSPIKCVGRISWHPEDNEGLRKDQGECLARVFVTHISRIDGKRLDLILTQKRLLARGPYLSP